AFGADGQRARIDDHLHRRTREILEIGIYFTFDRASYDLVLVPGETDESSLAHVQANAACARVDHERAGRCRGRPKCQQRKSAGAASEHGTTFVGCRRLAWRPSRPGAYS